MILEERIKFLKSFFDWDLPLTFSILPFTPYSKTLAGEAHRRGKEVILHLPMEPHGYPKVRPGEGVLLEEMDEARLLRQLSKDIEAVPYIKGVSNHMGSRLMEDPEKMRIIFSELKRRGLFFLDSRTTPQTVGLQVAQSVGLKAMERSLFIDHSSDEEDIKQKLEKLIQLSLSNRKGDRDWPPSSFHDQIPQRDDSQDEGEGNRNRPPLCGNGIRRPPSDHSLPAGRQALFHYSGRLENFQNFIPRKRFELFTTFLINLQNSRWPFLHFTDDLEGNGIFSEGFLN